MYHQKGYVPITNNEYIADINMSVNNEIRMDIKWIYSQ